MFYALTRINFYSELDRAMGPHGLRVPAKDPSHGTGPRFSLGPWAGSLYLGTYRNYPRPY
jgi:hypothetical protein